MTLHPVVIALGPSALPVARRVAAALTGAEVHGLSSRIGDGDVLFDDAMAHIRGCFVRGHPVIGVCASGILIRAVSPVLQDKHAEPPLIAVGEDGSCVVPLLGGHHGGNEMARQIGDALDVPAAITTAGELRIGAALDDPPRGWVLANPEAAKDVMAGILAGEPVAVDTELVWLSDRLPSGDAAAALRLSATVDCYEQNPGELVYHPTKVVIGVGSDRGCPPDELIALVEQALTEGRVARAAIACVVSIDRKADEPAMAAVAQHLGVPLRLLTADEINLVAERIPNPSDIVRREVGVSGVAEGAALVASGAAGLRVEKLKSRRATCAIAVADQIVDPESVGRARGRVSIVGIGPGTTEWRSGEAVQLLTGATEWVGYGLYLDLIEDLKRGQREHRFDLGAEEARVRHALMLAGEGRDVALVCSGDAGIYAMASLAFELLALDPGESGLSDGALRAEVVVAPGISAVQAAAARAGAPIGHDFCCISLSDLLTPWPVIEQRIKAAAEGDFVVAFYNPRSQRRRDQLDRAVEILEQNRPPHTPVIVASSLGRPAEKVTVSTLAEFDVAGVDMMSLVVVGASTTQAFKAGDGRHRVFTPRGYAAKREAAE